MFVLLEPYFFQALLEALFTQKRARNSNIVGQLNLTPEAVSMNCSDI